MKIRPATNKDLKQVEDIFRLPELTIASGEYLSAGFLKFFLNKKYFLVAEDAGHVVGSIFGSTVRGGGVFIMGLAVKKNLRGQGIGTKLLKQFEKNVQSSKKKWVLLYASTVTSGTLNFYKKHKYDIGKNYIECAKDL